MNILYITSEAAPFCKTGGLADVLGSLPPAVAAEGDRVSVLLPLFVCEASWSLGENVCAAIYGRMGTEQSAAMTLTAPIQGLAIGALCGLSQAAGVIVGKRLGGEDYDGAYRAAKRLMVYGAVGASVLCAARCRAT